MHLDKTLEIPYKIINDLKLLPDSEQEMIKKTIDILPKAYAPYSKFHVAAGLLLSNGEILVNVNQENVSYPVGICAERTLLSMIDGLFDLNEVKIKAMVVTFKNTLKSKDNPEYIAPCGMCRQAILEFEKRNGVEFPIYLMHQEHESALKFSTIQSLMPFSFISF